MSSLLSWWMFWCPAWLAAVIAVGPLAVVIFVAYHFLMKVW